MNPEDLDLFEEFLEYKQNKEEEEEMEEFFNIQYQIEAMLGQKIQEKRDIAKTIETYNEELMVKTQTEINCLEGVVKTIKTVKMRRIGVG